MIRAKDLMPKTADKILVRAVALNVGQGDSTLFFIKDGQRYATMLADINMGGKNAIDVPALLKGVLGEDSLDIFLNTHPHDDHLRGIEELDKTVGFKTAMIADYDPGKDANEYYNIFDKIIERMRKENKDSVVEIDGSYQSQPLFDAELHVLAPAEYVVDDTAEKPKQERRALIHENCVVFKVGKDSSWVIQLGDADYDAFKKHIYKAHEKHLSAKVLFASHHGSKYFFWEKDKCETEDPWLAPLEAINPSAVVVSAPRRNESRFEHPDQEAMDLYSAKVGKENVFHTGKDRYSYIVDIYEDGRISKVYSDEGGLMQDYQIGKDDNLPFVKPSTPNGDTKPRQFG